MKLKNKKTGEVITLIDHIFDNYSSLDEFTEDWEEVKPEGPLIKDEKIRKAIRAWAEANNFFNEIEVHSITAGTRFSVGHYDIEFLGYFIYDLETNKTCTIDELCGEEEE